MALVLTASTAVSAQGWRDEISSNYFYIRLAANAVQYWDLPGRHPQTANKNIQFQIWQKDDDPYERTFIFPSINGSQNFAIKNKAGYVVDVSGKTDLNPKEKLQQKTGKKFKMKRDNGAQIQTWTLDGGVPEWQQWRLIIVDKNTVMFENVFTGKAIDVTGGNIYQNGTKLQSYNRNNSDSQKFVLEYADGPRKGQLLSFE
ncbi:MAG: hypothetical protein A2X11_09540 [Bacteroidetes bacterium GWE2_42_24]|nr:MAG: hypothetical protein A2X11_09540 [Bacteroidetes bacterium GWE2_42_24]OFY25751.1 MAG: hypothetical protein A2X09_09215 [Bacteroidetes bacterium GWF2_43_11]